MAPGSYHREGFIKNPQVPANFGALVRFALSTGQDPSYFGVCQGRDSSISHHFLIGQTPKDIGKKREDNLAGQIYALIQGGLANEPHSLLGRINPDSVDFSMPNHPIHAFLSQDESLSAYPPDAYTHRMEGDWNLAMDVDRLANNLSSNSEYKGNRYAGLWIAQREGQKTVIGDFQLTSRLFALQESGSPWHKDASQFFNRDGTLREGTGRR